MREEGRDRETGKWRGDKKREAEREMKWKREKKEIRKTRKWWGKERREEVGRKEDKKDGREGREEGVKDPGKREEAGRMEAQARDQRAIGGSGEAAWAAQLQGQCRCCWRRALWRPCSQGLQGIWWKVGLLEGCGWG